MKLGGVENKARIAMALFVLALLLTLGLSLSLYWQARNELADQHLNQLKLEATLIALQVSARGPDRLDSSLTEALERHRVAAAAALYSGDGKLVARASLLDHPYDWPQTLAAPTARREARVRTERGFNIAEVPTSDGAMLAVARPVAGSTSPFIFYLFSYQVVALICGLGLVFLVVRWLLRPYRRIVQAAKGSPVRASSAISESEFVVETFQALIEQLQAKERELAQLHAIERRRAERSERFSERVVANIPSGLVAIDSSGIVTSVNAQASEIFGATAAREPAYHSRSVDSRTADEEIDYETYFCSSPRMIELVRECLSSGASFRREEVDVARQDGLTRHLGLSISPIADASHNLEGALCLMTDLTEVIDLRERMKLQESLANLGEMAAGLAHEFKNSLATIHGYVQLLDLQDLREATVDERRQALEATLKEVRLLARLVTDFLNFARPQHLNLSPVDLLSMVEDSARELRAQLGEAGIDLRIEGDFAEIVGDDTLLRRAFSNLLRNAAEAIDPQSPTRLIEVTGSTTTAPGRRYAHVRIKDTGRGISVADLHRIFIPFFTTKSRGYGIGLAIVQKIIMAHGGAVTVESSDSSGTTFDCRLPITPPTGTTGELALPPTA
jgi:signal transduction histidine kinase